MSKAKRASSRVRCSAVGERNSWKLQEIGLVSVHLEHAVTSMLGRGRRGMPTCRAGVGAGRLSKHWSQEAGRVAQRWCGGVLGPGGNQGRSAGGGWLGDLGSSVRSTRVNLWRVYKPREPKHAVSAHAPNLSVADLKRYRHCTPLWV